MTDNLAAIPLNQMTEAQLDDYIAEMYERAGKAHLVCTRHDSDVTVYLPAAVDPDGLVLDLVEALNVRESLRFDAPPSRNLSWSFPADAEDGS